MKGTAKLRKLVRERQDRLDEEIERRMEIAEEEVALASAGMDCYGSLDDAHPEWSGATPTTYKGIDCV